MKIAILFVAQSGNQALATTEFGPNKSVAIKVFWMLPESQEDIREFETAVPDLMAAMGINIRGGTTSGQFESEEAADRKVREFFAGENRN
jgi:hypothetical protein